MDFTQNSSFQLVCGWGKLEKNEREMELDEQFHILKEYLRTKEEEKVKEVQNQDEEVVSNDSQAEICYHPNQVIHEGYYVCTDCGIVLDMVFEPEVDWEKRCVLAKTYSSADRIEGVDKHLRHFMEKTGIRAQHHAIQEKLEFMKKECGYNSLNYAIALTCILEGDQESLEKLRPFLPQSYVAWARSSRVLPKPLSTHFIATWLRHLTTHSKSLSKSQRQKFHENIARFQPEQTDIMYRMIQCFGCYGYNIDSLPPELSCALYRFSCAILK